MGKGNKLSSVTTAGPAEDLSWRAKDALHTLTRAEEIKKDKALMKHVKIEAKNQMKALSTVHKPSGRK